MTPNITEKDTQSLSKQYGISLPADAETFKKAAEKTGYPTQTLEIEDTIHQFLSQEDQERTPKLLKNLLDSTSNLQPTAVHFAIRYFSDHYKTMAIWLTKTNKSREKENQRLYAIIDKIGIR